MAAGPGRGQDLKFSINDGTALRDMSIYIRSVSGLPVSDAPVIDKTAAGAASRTYLKGIRSSTFTVSGVYDNTALTGPATVFGLLVDDVAPTAFEYGPQGSTTAFVKYTGNAWVTSFSASEDYDGIVLFTANLTVDGAVTIGAY